MKLCVLKYVWVWNQDHGSVRATIISLVELMFPLSVF
jgi:hypothetical protein